MDPELQDAIERYRMVVAIAKEFEDELGKERAHAVIQRALNRLQSRILRDRAEQLGSNTIQALAGYYRKLVSEWGYPVIVQQTVLGDERNVVGVGDGEGNSLGLVGVRKTSVTSLGKVWSAVTVRNVPMLTAAERFVSQFRWRGPCAQLASRAG